jgi:hypothetical protein
MSRDWREMGRRDFDTAAPPPVQQALFPLPDEYGTGDLFDLQDDDARSN